MRERSRCRIIMLRVVIMASAVSLMCERSAVETYEPELNVYSILLSDHASQRVVVDRTYRMDESAGDFIDDALVVVSGRTAVDTLVFDQGTHAYWTYNLIIQPLDGYSLTVWRDGFDTVYAHTTVPGSFSILFPEHYDTVTFNDTVVLTLSEHAAVYAVSYGDEFEDFFDAADTSDGLMKIPLGEIFAGWAPGTFFCRLWIAAGDSNFYQYHVEQAYDPDETGVTGGVGVFGSLWVESVDIFVGLMDTGSGVTPVAPQ